MIPTRPKAGRAEMGDFLDVACSACGLRFGWHGEIGDHPKCPRCGGELDVGGDAAEVDRFREFLQVRARARKEGRKLNAVERERWQPYMYGREG
jgi:PHP family Zn ribbon phosphoesterase